MVIFTIIVIYYQMFNGGINMIYEINGLPVNVEEVLNYYGGNTFYAIDEIVRICHVPRSTAKYYVKLQQGGMPFKKQNSALSFLCGVLSIVPFVLPLATQNALVIGGIVWICFFASFVCGIVDLALIADRIPKKHTGTIIGFVIISLFIMRAIFEIL